MLLGHLAVSNRADTQMFTVRSSKFRMILFHIRKIGKISIQIICCAIALNVATLVQLIDKLVPVID
jgi:hypothetical protein